MKAKILIIEDEKEMADLISIYLTREGVETDCCESAEDGVKKLSLRVYDLVILDINLPGMDGFEFLQRFRKDYSTPVIIVSAREADEDIVMGLGIGADEFVVKPFSPRVLAARVRAILRRTRSSKSSGSSSESSWSLKGDEPERAVIGFGAYILDLDGYILKKKRKDTPGSKIGGCDSLKRTGGYKRIPLSMREFEVLKYLALNEGKALSPEKIYNSVWGNRFGDLTAVAVYIRRLRKKIEDNPAEPCFLETVRGKGYRFNRD
ncbi:MAG: response regulator transcription factor [Spirochaetes bacterium]|nr:response regulator transcription factor [Spirochaetota bacterium]